MPVKSLHDALSTDRQCPACFHIGNFKVYGTKGVLRLLICSSCRLVFADPTIWKNPYSQRDYYDQQEERPYPLILDETVFERVQSAQRFMSKGKWLDIGGGRGETVIAAQQKGYAATLLEQSSKAIRLGQEYYPSIRWICGETIPKELLQEEFDVVTLYHVLEHVPQPVPTLKKIHKLLSGKGVCVLEVPDWGCFNRVARGMKWQYVIDHHVNYFSLGSLTKLLKSCGFTIVSYERRRTFAINQAQPWKEPIKRVLSAANFGNILRVFCQREDM